MRPGTESEPLPGLYAQWITEFLGGTIPRESRATCNACAMCAREGQESASASYFFDPVVKCCSYVPDLHNFLVGRILSDTDLAAQLGRATVERRIQDAVGVTPLGLQQPPVYARLYGSSSKAFGRSRALRCPHYVEDGNRCGIWRNRESTCATWFCKHVRGDLGYRFWRDSLHPLLRAVETDLAHWCVLELELGDEALRQLVASGDWTSEAQAITGDSLDNRVDQKVYARMWGEWRGRQYEFYCRCGELVSTLTWADVLAICGPNTRAYARLTQESYRGLISDDIPSNLCVGRFEVLQVQRAVTRVNTYNDFDPLDVPNTVMELLQYFDGRPVVDALAAIADERGVSLDAALIRKMVDFKLLVPPETLVSTRESSPI
jgi:Fe-S-cluster containining protein